MAVPNFCNDYAEDLIQKFTGLDRLDLTNPLDTVNPQTLPQQTASFDRKELSSLNCDVFDCFPNDNNPKIKNTEMDADLSLDSMLKVTKHVNFMFRIRLWMYLSVCIKY